MTEDQKTVIVVEDEPDAAELFAEMMRVSGFRVLKTYSSTPAISMIAQEQPDVVIMDFAMPKLNGIEATRHIKAVYPSAHQGRQDRRDPRSARRGALHRHRSPAEHEALRGQARHG